MNGMFFYGALILTKNRRIHCCECGCGCVSLHRHPHPRPPYGNVWYTADAFRIELFRLLERWLKMFFLDWFFTHKTRLFILRNYRQFFDEIKVDWNIMISWNVIPSQRLFYLQKAMLHISEFFFFSLYSSLSKLQLSYKKFFHHICSWAKFFNFLHGT